MLVREQVVIPALKAGIAADQHTLASLDLRAPEGPSVDISVLDVLAGAVAAAAGRFGRARIGKTARLMLSTASPRNDRSGLALEDVLTELNLASLKLSEDVRLLARSELQRQWNLDGNNRVITAMNRLLSQPDYFSPVPYVRAENARDWVPMNFAPVSTLFENVAQSAHNLNSLYAKHVKQLMSANHGIAKERTDYVLSCAERDRYADAAMLVLAYMARDFGFPPVGADGAVPLLRGVVQGEWAPGSSSDSNARSLYTYVRAGVLMLAAEELRKVTRRVWRKAGANVPVEVSALIEELHEDGAAARDCDLCGPFDRIAVSFQYDCGGRLPIPKHTSQTPRWQIRPVSTQTPLIPPGVSTSDLA